jgi:hypothetical protein
MTKDSAREGRRIKRVAWGIVDIRTNTFFLLDL